VPDADLVELLRKLKRKQLKVRPFEELPPQLQSELEQQAEKMHTSYFDSVGGRPVAVATVYAMAQLLRADDLEQLLGGYVKGRFADLKADLRELLNSSVKKLRSRRAAAKAAAVKMVADSESPKRSARATVRLASHSKPSASPKQSVTASSSSSSNSSSSSVEALYAVDRELCRVLAELKQDGSSVRSYRELTDTVVSRMDSLAVGVAVDLADPTAGRRAFDAVYLLAQALPCNDLAALLQRALAIYGGDLRTLMALIRDGQLWLYNVCDNSSTYKREAMAEAAVQVAVGASAAAQRTTAAPYSSNGNISSSGSSSGSSSDPFVGDKGLYSFINALNADKSRLLPYEQQSKATAQFIDSMLNSITAEYDEPVKWYTALDRVYLLAHMLPTLELAELLQRAVSSHRLGLLTLCRVLDRGTAYHFSSLWGAEGSPPMANLRADAAARLAKSKPAAAQSTTTPDNSSSSSSSSSSDELLERHLDADVSSDVSTTACAGTAADATADVSADACDTAAGIAAASTDGIVVTPAVAPAVLQPTAAPSATGPSSSSASSNSSSGSSSSDGSARGSSEGGSSLADSRARKPVTTVNADIERRVRGLNRSQQNVRSYQELPAPVRRCVDALVDKAVAPVYEKSRVSGFPVVYTLAFALPYSELAELLQRALPAAPPGALSGLNKMLHEGPSWLRQHPNASEEATAAAAALLAGEAAAAADFTTAHSSKSSSSSEEARRSSNSGAADVSADVINRTDIAADVSTGLGDVSASTLALTLALSCLTEPQQYRSQQRRSSLFRWQ
jgi:hypothetical protein